MKSKIKRMRIMMSNRLRTTRNLPKRVTKTRRKNQKRMIHRVARRKRFEIKLYNK